VGYSRKLCALQASTSIGPEVLASFSSSSKAFPRLLITTHP